MSEGTRGREDGPTQALAYAAECAASATQRGSARWRQLAAACTPWQSGCSGASFASQGRHEWCPPHDDGGFLHAGSGALRRRVAGAGDGETAATLCQATSPPGSRFSKTSGRNFLSRRYTGYLLYLSDPCEHAMPSSAADEDVGAYRGVFHNFTRSRTGAHGPVCGGPCDAQCVSPPRQAREPAQVLRLGRRMVFAS